MGDKRTMMDLMETTRQVLLVDRNNAEALYFMGVFE